MRLVERMRPCAVIPARDFGMAIQDEPFAH
jgi:hypothetical protein